MPLKTLPCIKEPCRLNMAEGLSSVVDIKMNDGNNKDYHVSGGLGLIASRLAIEGPIVKDRGSFIVSARRTYADRFSQIIARFNHQPEQPLFL